MAAELDQLIERYREYGLERAARALETIEIGLIGQEVLPERLAPPGALMKPARTRRVDARNERERGVAIDVDVPRNEPTEANSTTRYRVQVRHRELAQVPPDDELNHVPLTRLCYTALRRAGVCTIDDVVFLINHNLLNYVRGIETEDEARITHAYRRHIGVEQ